MFFFLWGIEKILISVGLLQHLFTQTTFCHSFDLSLRHIYFLRGTSYPSKGNVSSIYSIIYCGSFQSFPNTKWPYSYRLHLLHWPKEHPMFRKLLGIITKRYLHLETSHLKTKDLFALLERS